MQVLFKMSLKYIFSHISKLEEIVAPEGWVITFLLLLSAGVLQLNLQSDAKQN